MRNGVEIVRKVKTVVDDEIDENLAMKDFLT
jgi:hypothetical protein